MRTSLSILPLLLALVAACSDSVANIGGHDSLEADAPRAETALPDGNSANTGTALDPAVSEVRVAHVFLGMRHSCNPDYRTLRYVRATRTMTLEACAFEEGSDAAAQGTPWPAETRVLSEADGKRVESVLEAMRVVELPCTQYDGSEYYLDTLTSSGLTGTYSYFNTSCFRPLTVHSIPTLYDLLVSLR